MKKIIAVANQKGGVGKTTTAVNLGTALQLMGNKVLLCDLDPQANMSAYLGFEDDGKPTMSDLVMTAANNFTMGATRKEMPKTADCIRYNEKNKVNFIPSDIGLAYADACLMQAATRESILKQILSDEIISDYDYVFIDCLPSLGILLINALSAADGVITSSSAKSCEIRLRSSFAFSFSGKILKSGKMGNSSSLYVLEQP